MRLNSSTDGDPCAGTRDHATRQCEIESALVESEARKTAILNTSLDAIVTVDRNGLTCEFNPAAERLFGHRREDVLGKELAPLIIPPSVRQEYLQSISELQATGTSAFLNRRVESTGMRADGTTFPIELTVTHFRVHGESLVTGTIRDIGRQKEWESALREQKDQVRLLLDSTAEAIYGLDLEGRCTLCNPACARMLGYSSPADLLGKNLHDLIHYQTRNGNPILRENCPILHAYRRNEGTHVTDEVFWRADGTCFPVEYWSYPVARENEVIGAVVTFLDITLRRDLEEQVLQAQKMEAVGRLAGGIAHDFNNLLTVITGFSEFALTQLPPVGPVQNAIAQVKAAGDRAAALTRQLLAFSRKQVLVPVVLDLNGLLNDMKIMLQRLIGEDIELLTRQCAAQPLIQADAGQIEQVILNLVLNARDAMPQGGILTIESANIDTDQTCHTTLPGGRIGRFCVLAVSDTGCGLHKATQARIFEPFFTTKEAGKGTGLGLATVWGIVKQSGGHIEVDSEVGIGTTFKVYLPCTSAFVEKGEAIEISNAVSGTETILLVEDEDQVRAFARLILESYGYSVLEARCGREAIALAGQFQEAIHLLVSDVVMPKMSGLQLAKHLEVSRPDMGVLFLSGYTDDAIVNHGIVDGSLPFLQKPFSKLGLARKVRELLDAQNLRKS